MKDESKALVIGDREESKEEGVSLEKDTEEPLLSVVEPEISKPACPDAPSVHDQQWLYLNLLQQQLDILRAQMGAMQPVIKVEKMNVDQKPVAFSTGTNTSFVTPPTPTQQQRV